MCLDGSVWVSGKAAAWGSDRVGVALQVAPFGGLLMQCTMMSQHQ
jgi:hypothetical protein